MSQPELQQYLGDMTNANYDDLKSEYLWAKRRFRQFSGKSSRKSRFPRKSWSMSMSSGKGRRKGGRPKGKRGYHYEPSVMNHSSLAGGKSKGKGKGKKSKGFGGKMHFMSNPKGSDGETMKCHECQSTDHLIARCPKKKGGKGKGKRFMTEDQAQPSQFAYQSGVLAGIVNGQNDNWFGFVDNTTVKIEEVEEDWTTVTQQLTIADDEPQNKSTGIKGHTMFFPSWEVSDMRTNKGEETYLVRTRMKNATGSALLVDPGSPNNLCGDQWSKEMQDAALAANRSPIKYQDLPRPLEMGGIGTGTQTAYQTGLHSIGLSDGTEAIFESPVLPNSGTPALLGQKSLKNMQAVLDCYNNKLYRIGPGGYEMKLSPGSVVYDLEESHSGHLMLPCSRFAPRPNQQQEVEHFAAGAETGSSSSSFVGPGKGKL
jgi:hypothetical protein